VKAYKGLSTEFRNHVITAKYVHVINETRRRFHLELKIDCNQSTESTTIIINVDTKSNTGKTTYRFVSINFNCFHCITRFVSFNLYLEGHQVGAVMI
jgi:hypothetical protein